MNFQNWLQKLPTHPSHYTTNFIITIRFHSYAQVQMNNFLKVPWYTRRGKHNMNTVALTQCQKYSCKKAEKTKKCLKGFKFLATKALWGPTRYYFNCDHPPKWSKASVGVDCKATGSCGHLAWGSHRLKTGGMILPAENEGEETPLPFSLPEFRPPSPSVHARLSLQSQLHHVSWRT